MMQDSTIVSPHVKLWMLFNEHCHQITKKINAFIINIICIMPDKCSYMQSLHLLKVLTKNIPIQAHWKNMPMATFQQNDITLLLAHLQHFSSEMSSE